MEEIVVRPIGVVHSPYREGRGMPIQGRFEPGVEGCIEVLEPFAGGLRDLEGFSHAIVLYHFHLSQREDIVARPFLEQVEHGIFSIRSPHRPNHIGLSIVRIERIEANKLYFTEVDMVDGTPVLDIKPYVKYFDSREDVRCGWVDKHFADGNRPDTRAH